RAEDCFGYHSDALLAMSVDDLVPSEARTKHVSQRESYMKHPTIKTVRSIFDMRGRRSDGTEFPVEVNLAPATMGDETLVISIIRDYSDHRELEAQLRQSQKMEAIGQLTGGMAHDFNNLLGVIIGNLDLASRNVDEDSPARKRLETAKRAAKRGADLTRRMLAVARRQSLKPQPASINHVIEEISEILPRTLGPSVELVVKLQEQLPAVMVDQSEFENALLNLAINARDAMPQGGKLYIRTELATLGDDYLPVRNNEIPPGVYARISITDTGVGMTSEIMSRVFEPFYTTKEGGKGTGLGLAMIYGFIKQSRGNIRIYSEPGQGTTVNVYLPTTEQPVIAPEHVSAPVSNGIHGKESILVVDDEVELLEVAVTYLEELGYTVHPATDGNSALEMLDAHPSIDLLLTDVVMPGGMNGVALAKEVRKRSPRTKVLYTSGFPSNVLADKSEIKIDAPLIGKPYQKPDLAARVRDVLDNGNG
ncbi:MAG: response regulator, partial [Proteobacteria bacterium]